MNNMIRRYWIEDVELGDHLGTIYQVHMRLCQLKPSWLQYDRQLHIPNGFKGELE